CIVSIRLELQQTLRQVFFPTFVFWFVALLHGIRINQDALVKMPDHLLLDALPRLRAQLARLQPVQPLFHPVDEILVARPAATLDLRLDGCGIGGKSAVACLIRAVSSASARALSACSCRSFCSSRSISI